MSPFTINNPLYESIVPGRTFPCPPRTPGHRHEGEDHTFTSLTGRVFVRWERQRVCTAGGSLEVCLSGARDLGGSARQDRGRSLLGRMLPAEWGWGGQVDDVTVHGLQHK